MSLLRIIAVALALVATACGGTGGNQQFVQLSVDDSELGIQLESVAISSDDAVEFHQQYGRARKVTNTRGPVAAEPGFVMRLAGKVVSAGQAGDGATESTELAWDRAPFEGIAVTAETSVIADEPAEAVSHGGGGPDGCITLTAWDVWNLEPTPDPIFGEVAIVVPTTATLVTTIVIESTICG